ncbi:hypothetical protein SASPL_108920 [Salvia splendens]|uniref:Uncharacterized protein n=1 Tax=Salvia splendens TaxID=180675 RepID=A0A8X9A5U2_SALSN|nr:hypothetical protein SASPL_108920 [Salvia splendens]
MSSVRQRGKTSAQSSEGKRQTKGKAVDEGEGSGKRTRTTGKQSKSKTAVRQLGFGGLLEYDMAYIPTTLAYWLLEHFDHLRCSLKLPNGDEVGIGAKDVELIFDFPNGGLHFIETKVLDVDIYSMQTKVLDVDIPRNHTT